MSWGPIQLRLKGSKQVEFDGEASPAPGGGSMPVQAIYSGSAVNVGDGVSGVMTFDSLDSGTELLDRTIPAVPTFLAAGTYALVATYYGDALTAGGFAVLNAAMTGPGSAQNDTAHPETPSSVTLVGTAEAGDQMQVTVSNFDGASARNFQLYGAILVKLA